VPATLEAKDLAKSFSGPPVFSGLSLRAERGLTAVAGRNGSGKTTLLKILALLVRPDAGSVSLRSDGRELAGDARRRAIGWSGLDLAFYDELTARENLEFFRRAAGLPEDRADVLARIARVGLAADADRAVGGFSSGMKQRLRLAFALLLDPPVLLLDEPFAGMDADGRERVLEVVEEQRRRGAVLLASNDARDFHEPEQRIELGRRETEDGRRETEDGRR
jgi:ABC-type multidrug transport system ATPase subunit